nr:CHAP domain-containing protein [Aquisphaera insulae]
MEYARSQLGKKVGDGECTTLAVQALRRSGARRPDARRGIWGDEVPSLKEVQPGDILQFEDVVFFKRRRRADGAILTQTLTFPHHTAIVVKVQGKGSRCVLTILHQNTGVDGEDEETRRLVKEGSLELATMRSGTLRAYRPAAEIVPEDQAQDRPRARRSTPARDDER